MSIEWKIEKNNLAIFHVSGTLSVKDHQQILSEIESTVKITGQLGILVLIHDFEGWEKVDSWEENPIIDRIDPYIKKFAIVGNEKWRDMVTIFTLKGLRPVPIEYFTENEEAAAREWLESEV